MFKIITHAISQHPVISGMCGSVTTYIFSMINIPQTTEYLTLIGVIIKDIGIAAGTSVAVASAYFYFKKKFKNQNENRDHL